MTPIEKVCRAGDEIVLGNNFNHIMGPVSAADDFSSIETKIDYCDIPYHPLALHDSYSKNHGDLISLQANPKMEPLKMRSVQTSFITNTMTDLREREFAASTKRRKTGHLSVKHQEVLLTGYDSNGDEKDICTAVCADTDDDDSISSSRFDIQDELKAHPHAIPIVATSGGLITHWNEDFSKITRPSSSLRTTPLTIFDLVDLKSLPSLYSMLALSLHNIDVGKVENLLLNEKDESVVPVGGSKRQLSSASHLSITVPCKSFQKSSTRYNITVVFMHDIVSEKKRCFLGILIPIALKQNANKVVSSLASQDEVRADVAVQEEIGVSTTKDPSLSTPHIPCGKVIRVDDNLLCRILLDARII